MKGELQSTTTQCGLCKWVIYSIKLLFYAVCLEFPSLPPGSFVIVPNDKPCHINVSRFYFSSRPTISHLLRFRLRNAPFSALARTSESLSSAIVGGITLTCLFSLEFGVRAHQGGFAHQPFLQILYLWAQTLRGRPFQVSHTGEPLIQA